MAERRAAVAALEPGFALLAPEGACSDCEGCGGRCNLFAGIGGEPHIRVPLERFRHRPEVGQQVSLELPEAWLRNSALAGYGLPLLGLLAGCGLGVAVAQAAGADPNGPSLAGAALGLLAGVRGSRRLAPQLGVRLLPPPQPASIESNREHTPGVQP